MNVKVLDAPKKVLVLGGTGAMGVYLVPELALLGYDVSVTSRSAHTSNNCRVSFLQGDAKDDRFLQTLLTQSYDAVIDFMVYHTPDFEQRFETLLTNVNHYIFLSSYRVYSDNGEEPITEDSPRLLDVITDQKYLSTDEYALTKARQENMLKNSQHKNWTIVRPAITYSKSRFQLGTMEAGEFLYRALQNKDIIFPKEMLEKETTMSWAGDVARMIARLVLNEKAYGETYTVSTSEHHKWQEVVGYYQKILGVGVKIVDLDTYRKIIGRPWQIKYDRMFHRVIDNSKILSITNMEQEELMPLYDGLRIELAKFSLKPVFSGLDPEREAKIDAITGTAPSPAKKEQAKPKTDKKVVPSSKSQIPPKRSEKFKKELKGIIKKIAPLWLHPFLKRTWRKLKRLKSHIHTYIR